MKHKETSEDGGAGKERMVEGFKMEKMTREEETTELASSGVQWFASLFVLMLIGLFVFGSFRKNSSIITSKGA